MVQSWASLCSCPEFPVALVPLSFFVQLPLPPIKIQDYSKFKTKDSRLNSNTVQNCYNGFENFRKTLLDFDNKKIYRSELSDRIGI